MTILLRSILMMVICVNCFAKERAESNHNRKIDRAVPPKPDRAERKQREERKTKELKILEEQFVMQLHKQKRSEGR